MIHITGDTHGNRDWGKIFLQYRDKKIKQGDYLIICGDFGGVWVGNDADNHVLDRYAKLPFMILFVDGNHENFDALYQYPIEDWNGGKVHKIRENILHLMRGHAFYIEGKTFFTMGGGTSIDKDWRLQYEKEDRKHRKIWWEQEIPTNEELAFGNETLKQYGNNVDYIITHTQSNIFMKDVLGFQKEKSPLNYFLDYVFKNVEYNRWFCGHFHEDMDFDDVKVTMLYNKIVNV